MLSLLLSSIFGSILFYFCLRRFVLEHFYNARKGKYVFITGCDSGFGRLLSLKLVRTGVNVFSGCYTDKGAEELEKEARAIGGGQLKAVPIDVTKDESVKQARIVVENILKDKHASLHAIVNNAGVFTTFGPDDWCGTEEYMMSLNVNTLGAIRVTHQFLPLVKKSKGRVVTMGSTAGRLHGMYVAPYVTAKFAVEAYMDCLRLEMRPFGVSVHVLEPGAFKTELLSESAQHERVHRIWNKLPISVKEEYGEEYKENFKIAWQQGVNVVANPNLYWVVDSYIHALFATFPRLRYSPGWDAILCFVPLSVIPTYFQDTILSFMYSMQPGPPLVPRALRQREKQEPLMTRLQDIVVKAGHLSCLSIGFVVFWLRANLQATSERVVEQGNNTVTAN